MKAVIQTLLAGLVSILIIEEGSFAQGTFQGVFVFANNGARGLDGGARAPIFGPDPNNPSIQEWGNPTNASPPGTQDYFGVPLNGTNYSVEAWYSTNPVSNAFALLPEGRPVAQSLTSNLFGGFFSSLNTPTIPDALPNPAFPASTNYPYFVFLQVRAWDNAGGQFPTWTDAWNAALAGSGRSVGWSKVFWQALTSPIDTRPWPTIPNFESFNTFFVPEPSPGGLFLVGSAFIGLMAARRCGRRHHFFTVRRATLVGLVLLAAMSAMGQGEITFRNFSTTPVRTNSIGIGGTAGNTSSNANGFYYGLFIAASTVTSVSPTDLLTPTWTFTGVYATNTVVTVGRLYGGTGVQVPGWVDVTNSFVVAGWSANLASSDWGTVATQLSGASLSGGVWSGPNWHASSQAGFFGVSSIGLGFAPDPSLGQPPLELFGSGPTPQGYPISTGWDLFTINVPEPSIFALVVAGVVAMRFRKLNVLRKS